MQTNPNTYDVLKVSYKNSHGQAISLLRFGYNSDKQFSNDNQEAYFNPEKKKLIYTVTGKQYSPAFEIRISSILHHGSTQTNLWKVDVLY